MRSLLVIIDGLGDDPIPALNGLTPFQYTEHKNMDTSSSWLAAVWC